MPELKTVALSEAEKAGVVRWERQDRFMLGINQAGETTRWMRLVGAPGCWNSDLNVTQSQGEPASG